jgi:beta-glucuronidase
MILQRLAIMSKRGLLTIAMAALFVLMGNAQVKDISLCGEWRFVADSADYSTSLPSAAQVVSVPHTYNIMEGLEDYAGRAWYEKRILIPAEMKGRQLRLQFEAVYHDATVYVNGQKAGSPLAKAIRHSAWILRRM